MKKLLIALLVLGLVAPGMAMAQNLDQRVTELENNMQEFAKKGMKLKETIIDMKKMGFHFYGKIRPHIGYFDADDDFRAGPVWPYAGPIMDNTISGPDDSGTLLDLSSSSRFGAKVIASDSVSALIEMGLEDNGNNVGLRIAWGTWDFGAGKLSVGKYYTPGTFLGYSKGAGDFGDGGHGNMLLSGLPYIGRKPQARLSFGDFDIALVEQNGDAPGYGGERDFDIPIIEAAYVFRTDLVDIRPVAGFQTYEIESPAGQTLDIDSYLLGLGASFDLNPAYVKATVSFMQNAGNYDSFNAATGIVDGSQYAQRLGDEIEDSDLVQGTLVGGFTANEMVSFEGGIGYMNAEVDVAPGTTQEETAYLYYLQSTIALAENLDLIPEIGVLDRDTVELGGVETDRGKLTYLDVAFDYHF